MPEIFVMSGTRHYQARWSGRSPEPVINRHPEEHRPLLIGLGKTGRPAATFKIKTQNILEVVMSSRNEHARAQAQVRLQQETPITDDASLLPLQEEAAAIVREAKRRDPSGTDELVSTVLDEVARSYFRHALLHRSAVGRLSWFLQSRREQPCADLRCSLGLPGLTHHVFPLFAQRQLLRFCLNPLHFVR